MKFEFLGPYKVDLLLGRGGMGSVYRGVHSKSGEVVALKIIASTLADQERFRRRFATEIETIKRLQHPNIVRLIGYGEEQGHLFYSMEYVAGQNLGEQTKKQGPVRWDRAIEIGIEICAALKHAHDMGIIHRDLKPANVMISEEGQVKLTDFGIAKLFGNSDATAAGSVLGTADYMPPEQAEGKPVNNRSDLYALGALLYAIVYGKSPHAAKSVPEAMYNVRYTIPAKLTEIVIGTPPEFSEIVAQLLAKEAQDRPPTALVVGNRLQSLKAGLQYLENRAKRGDIDREDDDVGHSREFNSIDLNHSENSLDKTPGATAKGDPRGADKTVPSRPLARPSSDATVPIKSPLPVNLIPQGDKFAPLDDGNEQTEVVSSAEMLSRISQAKLKGSSVAGIKPIRGKTAVASAKTELASDSEVNSQLTGASMHDEDQSVSGKTRFTVVEERERRRSVLNPEHEEEESSWTQTISLVSLIALIAICLGSIYYFTRPPSANALFAQLKELTRDESNAELSEISDVLEHFQLLYPDDQRLQTFQPLMKEIEEEQTLRRLQRRNRSTFAQSSVELEPLEIAFIDAMRAREEDTDSASRKLRALLTIYQNQELLTDKQRGLIQMAEDALDEIQDSGERKVHPGLEKLQQQLDWAESKLAPDGKKAFYRSIIELYEEKSWAKPIIETSRKRLEQLLQID